MSNGEETPKIPWRIDEWFPDLSPEVRTSLKTYHDELIKFNRTVNLISAKTVLVADALHFADSILASKIIHNSNVSFNKIYDLGSGNGFPGMIFGILYPSIEVILVESDLKKCEFLRHIVSYLSLKNVKVENKTVESLGDGSVQYAMARGLSSISRSILLTRKTVPKGGVFFHLKGEEWGIEVGEIPIQLCSIWSPSLVGEYKLPIGAMKFYVIKTDKIA
ncbi:MAG: 16S rRNA (guanine(527)-N(7))-methyltransferase RsmG [Bdellovibrio sp.]